MTQNRYNIREPHAGDFELLAAHMRERDKEEAWASSHMAPLEAIIHSVKVSRDTTRVGTVDDTPVCIFGVQPPSLLGTVACPWMLGTDGVDLNSLAFLKRSKRWVRAASLEYPKMENFVDARNIASIRWLRWVGFTVYASAPWGRDGLLFHRFDLRRTRDASRSEGDCLRDNREP